MKRAKWIFNPLMIWGAVLGFIIFGALGKIRDAWHHQGAGLVTYEQPDRTVRVAEDQYKRHEYAMGGLLLVLGLSLWIVVAKGTRDNTKRPTAQGKCNPDGPANPDESRPRPPE